MIINPYRFAAAAGGLSASPTHWWDMDTTTTGIDDQGTGGSGSPWARLTNSSVVSESSPYAAPNGGDSLYFSATAYLNRSSVAWTGAGNDWSVSLWFNARNGFASSGVGTMIGWHNSAASTDGIFWIREIYNPNRALSLAIDDDWQIVQAESTATLSTNTWYHVVTTWNNATNTVSQYIDDGNLITATDINVANLPTAAMPFAIGAQANNTNGNRYEGNLWAIGIWDTILTASDVSYLFNSGTGRLYADL